MFANTNCPIQPARWDICTHANWTLFICSGCKQQTWAMQRVILCGTWTNGLHDGCIGNPTSKSNNQYKSVHLNPATDIDIGTYSRKHYINAIARFRGGIEADILRGIGGGTQGSERNAQDAAGDVRVCIRKRPIFKHEQEVRATERYNLLEIFRTSGLRLFVFICTPSNHRIRSSMWLHVTVINILCVFMTHACTQTAGILAIYLHKIVSQHKPYMHHLDVSSFTTTHLALTMYLMQTHKMMK